MDWTTEHSTRDAGTRLPLRVGIAATRPFLRSRRLVTLMQHIGALAVTRPEALTTVEAVVEKLIEQRPVRAQLAARRPKSRQLKQSAR